MQRIKEPYIADFCAVHDYSFDRYSPLAKQDSGYASVSVRSPLVVMMSTV